MPGLVLHYKRLHNDQLEILSTKTELQKCLSYLSDALYREFLYEDQYSPMLTLDIDRDELLFKESLKRVFGLKPQTDCDIGYGCPFCSGFVGFWEMPFSWENLE